MKKRFVLDGREALYVTTRDEWRVWLKTNHAEKQGVWLVFYKKHTGKPSLPYDEAVEEALCFGWIDSQVNRLDEERYIQKFTPRKKNSTWSALNKKRVQKMVRLGRVTEAGLRAIAEAKKNGSWTKLDVIERLDRVPPDLAKAIAGNAQARKHFNKLPDSAKNSKEAVSVVDREREAYGYAGKADQGSSAAAVTGQDDERLLWTSRE